MDPELFKRCLRDGPEAHGYIVCPHCHGYGSSLKDPEGVNRCTRCGGDGLVKAPEEEAP